jgi:hypothetical protein
MRPLDQPSSPVAPAEPSFEANADRAEVIGHDRAVLHCGPSLARRPAGDFAEDFAIESFLICRLAPDQRLAAMGFDAEGSDARFLQVLDALL